MKKEKIWLLLSGIVLGLASVILVLTGNPANMGLCVACFIRDISGALGLHRADTVQYMRPEILGMILGAFILAVGKKEFSVRGGSSPVQRFILGFVVIVGALMFLGCPMRMVLRIAGGDLNAVIGLLGFVAGIGIGAVCLNKGFTLGRTHSQKIIEGIATPVTSVVLLVMLLVGAGFLFFSETGPGSMHAPIWIALLAGAIAGALVQHTRLCTMGGFRDLFLFRDGTYLIGIGAVFVTVLVGNLITGSFNLGFIDQPVAHSDGLWNFMGMVVVGFGSVLLGGCPLRQVVLAGEGNADSAITLIGMLTGAAFSHNLGLASSPQGPTTNGKIAVVIGLLILVIIGVVNTAPSKKKAI